MGSILRTSGSSQILPCGWVLAVRHLLLRRDATWGSGAVDAAVHARHVCTAAWVSYHMFS